MQKVTESELRFTNAGSVIYKRFGRLYSTRCLYCTEQIFRCEIIFVIQIAHSACVTAGMQSQGLSLERYAKREVKVLVVANPANTNMLVLLKTVTTIPKGNFTCLTRLDEERLRFVVADKINRDLRKIHGEAGTGGGGGRLVRAQDVKNVFIFGNHSTTQVGQGCLIRCVA